ncbi:hypothetical protein WN943_004069 [Citrus x changshan-huyou]
MTAIGYARHEVQEYIQACFSRYVYLNTYSVMFSLLLDQCINNIKSAIKCFRVGNTEKKTGISSKVNWFRPASSYCIRNSKKCAILVVCMYIFVLFVHVLKLT